MFTANVYSVANDVSSFDVTVYCEGAEILNGRLVGVEGNQVTMEPGNVALTPAMYVELSVSGRSKFNAGRLPAVVVASAADRLSLSFECESTEWSHYGFQNKE